jgi:hypothetical protein
MKAVSFGLAALLLFPAGASAVVVMHVEDWHVTPNERDQVGDVEVYATNADAAENERLDSFTIGLEAPTFRPDGGAPRFVLPPANPDGTFSFGIPTVHPYVISAFPGAGPVDPIGVSDYNTALMSFSLGGTAVEVDLSDSLNGFAKLKVLIPADTPEGIYPINFDPQFLALGSAGAPIVVTTEPGRIIVGPVPEPGAAGVLAGAAALSLLRGAGGRSRF